MSLMQKIKRKVGASSKQIIHNIKEEAKYRKIRNSQIKAKQKEAFYKERERIAIKKGKERAHSGGLSKFMGGGSSGRSSSGFSGEIDMGGLFESPKNKTKKSKKKGKGKTIVIKL